MYKILRVPPNKDSYYKAYEILIGWIGVKDKSKVTAFDNFYNKTDTIYMLCDERYQVYEGICFAAHGYSSSKIPQLNGECWILTILTFNDEDNYNKVYDMVNTITRDKKDKPIIVDGIVNEDECKNFINALKNNKFKKSKNSEGKIIYYLIPSMFDAVLDTNFKKVNFFKDANVLDELCVFYDPPVAGEDKEYDMIPIEQDDRCIIKYDKCHGCQYCDTCKPNDKCKIK